MKILKTTAFWLTISLTSLVFLSLTGCNNPLEELFVQSLTLEEEEAQELITEILNQPDVVAVDVTAPAVAFVNPIDGQYYSGILLVAGVAADASEVVSVETRLDGGSWKARTPGQYWSFSLNTGLIAEGVHTLYARAADEKGNESSEVSLSFTVDRDVPEVSITSHTHGEYVSGDISYGGTSSDNLNIVSVSIIPDQGGLFYEAVGTTSWSYGPFDTTTVDDGTLVVLVEARDDANNRGTESIAIIVDNTPPELSLNSPADQTTIDAAVINVSGTALDAVDVEKVEVQLDSSSYERATLEPGGAGDERAWSFSFDASGLSEGAHTISAVATDQTGNISPIQTATIYFDTTPPEMTVSSPAAGVYLNEAATVNVSGTVTNLPDAEDTVEYSTDGSSYSQVLPAAYDGSGSWSHTLDVSGLPDGLITVYIKAADATTLAWDMDSVSFYLDRTPPAGIFSSPAAGAEVFDTIQVSGSVSDNVALASINSVAVYIENTTTTATTAVDYPVVTSGLWSSQFDIASFASGNSCTIHVTITDEAGNITLITRNISITDTVPSGIITSPANGALVMSAGFTVTGTAAGGSGNVVSSVEIKVDDRDYFAATDTSGGSWTSWEYSTDTAGISPDGYYNLTARITNSITVSVEIPITIEVDNTAPVVIISYPADTNIGDLDYLYGTVDSYGTASDEHLSSLDVLVDEVSQGAPAGTDTWTYAWNTAATPGARNGTVYKLTATDGAGNTGDATVTVDVRPQISLFEVGGTEVESVLTDEVMDIIGNNFRDDLPSGTPVLNTVFPASSLASSAASSTTITVTVPTSAESGYVYVEEGDDGTANPIRSNQRYLHIWNDFTGIAGVTANQALALSGTDRYQVGYVGGGTKELYFSKNGASVQIGGDKDQDTSIAVTSSYIYVVYSDNTNSGQGGVGLVFKRSAAEPVSFDTTVEFGVRPVAGATTSIAVDGNNAAIVYQDGSGVLIYTASADNGNTWPVTETVDTTGITCGLYSEIVFDSTGNPVVVYFDETNQMAKFAYRDSGGWHTSYIETAVWKGEYISLALDSSDGIHLSYYDSGSGDLRYAYAADKYSSFTTITVDDTGIVGMYTDITTDSDNKPHISYYNNNYTSIHYAYLNSSESWEIVDFPSGHTASAADKSSIEIGSDGYIYIGYTDGANAKVLQYRN